MPNLLVLSITLPFCEFQKLLEELENEEIPAYIREARLQTLKQQATQFKNMHEKGYGRYRYVYFYQDTLNPCINMSYIIVVVLIKL